MDYTPFEVSNQIRIREHPSYTDISNQSTSYYFQRINISNHSGETINQKLI